MIWNVATDNSALATALAGQIRQDVESVRMALSSDFDVAQVEALADAVAAFVARHHDPERVGTDFLLLLTARALWAAGELRAAECLIAEQGSETQLSPLYAALAVTPAVSLSGCRTLVESRALRPLESAAGQGQLVWVLDLERVMSATPGMLELTVWRALNALLERLAGLWDATRGSGVLGLSHVSSVVSAMLGRSRTESVCLRQIAQVRRHCLSRLRGIGVERGWRMSPDVWILDA